MLKVIYWRPEANIIDCRIFKDIPDIVEWLSRQVRLEPTGILGIYEKWEGARWTRDWDRFYKYFVENREG